MGEQQLGPDAAEQALLARLKAGDDRAYEELVRTHAPKLLSTVRRLLESEEDAREAVQEAFSSAFRAIPRFEGNARLSTWLHRIAVNAALMKLRRQRRKPEVPIDELLPTFHGDGHRATREFEWDGSPALDLERREEQERVRAAIDRLPPTYRNVLLLRDIEELTTEEAAAALGVSENAVKIRLHRARQALRELLAAHYEKERSAAGETKG